MTSAPATLAAEAPPLGVWRRAHRAAAIAVNRKPGRMVILSIVHAGEGGAIWTNQDLMLALAREGHRCFILNCGPRKWTLESAVAQIDRREEVVFEREWRAWDAPCPARMAAFRDVLERLDADIVHLRSFLGCGPEIAREARDAQRGVVVSYHDYTAVCPTIHLLDAELRHCGGVCTPGEADCSAPAKWFAGLPRLKNAHVHVWRARAGAALAHAHAHVTTSPAAAALLKRRLECLRWARVHVIAHGRDEPRFAAARIPRPGERPAIVALNAEGEAKGARLIAYLAARNAAAGEPFAIHTLGGKSAPYARADLPALLTRIGPSFALVPSLWPETYSHTLTECWRAGVPALVSALGATGERVRRAGGGWRLDPGDPEAWWTILRQAAADPLLWAKKAHEIKEMPLRDTAAMAHDYRALYARVLRRAGRSVRLRN